MRGSAVAAAVIRGDMFRQGNRLGEWRERLSRPSRAVSEIDWNDQSRLGHDIYHLGGHRILHLRERSRRLQRDDARGHFRRRFVLTRKTHLVYFPLENINGRPLLRIMEPSPAS